MGIVGVTTLDVVRANKFTSSLTGSSVRDAQIPVVGGHAGVTILPLFSQCPVGQLGPEVVLAKAGKGSATLSMAYSGARFGSAVLSGLAGTPTTECAYVASDVTELPYFASKVTFGLS